MLKHKLFLSMLFAALLGLGGCATDTATKGDGDGTGTTTGAGKFSPERMKQLLAKRTVYFEFDSSTLVGENLEVVQAHGQHLAANAKTKVVFEGHADERGTREYNLALGERRGQSVERVMRALGVGSIVPSSRSARRSRWRTAMTNRPEPEPPRRDRLLIDR